MPEVIEKLRPFSFLCPLKVISHRLSSTNFGFPIGFLGFLAMIGGIIAQSPALYLINISSFETSMLINGLLGILIALLNAYVLESDSHLSLATNLNILFLFNAIKRIFKVANLKNLLCASYAALMNLSLGIFGALWGTVFISQSQQVSLEKASLISSLLFVGHIIGSPFLGWISDKLTNRKNVMILGALISLLATISILKIDGQANHLYFIAILFFLLGFFAGTQPLAYAIVVETSKKEFIATSASLISILTMATVAIMQPTFAFLMKNNCALLDKNSICLTYGLYLTAFCYLLALIIPMLIKYENKVTK